MIKFAKLKDKNEVNVIRNQVHRLHVINRPDIFRDDFSAAAERYDMYVKNYDYAVLACIRDGIVVGFAVIKTVDMPLSDFGISRKYLSIEELGVHEAHRRRGVGKEIVDFIKQYAYDHELDRIQLDYWAFNENAGQFYEKMGFKIYRQCAEYFI